MSDRPENPPAFPKSVGTFNGDENLGLELRDYFAAKAMQTFLHPEHLNKCRSAITDGESTVDAVNGNVALAAYLMADAMLLERAE